MEDQHVDSCSYFKKANRNKTKVIIKNITEKNHYFSELRKGLCM